MARFPLEVGSVGSRFARADSGPLCPAGAPRRNDAGRPAAARDPPDGPPEPGRRRRGESDAGGGDPGRPPVAADRDPGQGQRAGQRRHPEPLDRGWAAGAQQGEGGCQDGSGQDQREPGEGRRRPQPDDPGALPGRRVDPAVGQLDAQHHRDHRRERPGEDQRQHRVEPSGEGGIRCRRDEHGDDQRSVELAEPPCGEPPGWGRVGPPGDQDRPAEQRDGRIPGQREAQCGQAPERRADPRRPQCNGRRERTARDDDPAATRPGGATCVAVGLTVVVVVRVVDHQVERADQPLHPEIGRQRDALSTPGGDRRAEADPGDPTVQEQWPRELDERDQPAQWRQKSAANRASSSSGAALGVVSSFSPAKTELAPAKKASA